jgi:VWFA-related protein
MARNVTRLLLCAFVSAALSAMAQSTAPQPDTTIRTTSDLVVVDVTVANSQQNPVHHLTSADFTILEDGKPQTLKYFEEHVLGPPQQLAALPKFEPGTFTNYTSTPANGALNILLFDKLNTPINAQSYVRDQVLRYLKAARPGTPIAIFTLTTQLKLLQGFSSNPGLLRALVMSKKGSQGASPLMDNAMEGDQPGADDPMMDMANEAMGNDPDPATVLADIQQFEAEQQSFQIQLRQRYTLDALNQLARYMSKLPGRKNLIWFSGSFPISILPDSDLQNPFAVVADASEEFRQTVDLLSRSQVAVYPIDARGLMVAPMLSATQSGSTMTRTPDGFAKANAKWTQNTAQEQGTMQQMALATGGRAFVNTNDLKESVEKAIDEGSNYYTIAYTPTNRDWNGNYRKIQIKVSQPGTTLAYRRGYFADDLAKQPNGAQPGAPHADPARYSAFRAAMQRGGPEPTEIIFLASVRPSSADTETALAPGNQPGKKASGPYRRYTVTFIANSRELNCEAAPDGVHHCAFQFLSVVYDDDGTPIVQQGNGINADIPADRYAALMKENVTYSQQISVPVKGAYYLRVGIRDAMTDRVGAVEIPIAAVAKLPPPAPQAAAPTAAPGQK